MKKADKHRFDFLQQLGCVACLLEGHYRWGDVHHLLEGYRKGHQYTISACPWHHRGVTEGALTASEALSVYGPSLALDKKSFNQRYISEDFLLELVNLAYEAYIQAPYNGVPATIRQQLRQRWESRRK